MKSSNFVPLLIFVVISDNDVMCVQCFSRFGVSMKESSVCCTVLLVQIENLKPSKIGPQMEQV